MSSSVVLVLPKLSEKVFVGAEELFSNLPVPDDTAFVVSDVTFSPGLINFVVSWITVKFNLHLNEKHKHTNDLEVRKFYLCKKIGAKSNF